MDFSLTVAIDQHDDGDTIRCVEYNMTNISPDDLQQIEKEIANLFARVPSNGPKGLIEKLIPFNRFDIMEVD